ncbi:MAG: Arc family DNA-binding protein [Planctomycetota bacterium]|nr:Arc family DNA-binding protein [Planctomycetota bacterium]
MAKRDSFLLRLNPTTMDALRRWSEDEFRSMNSQIEMVLQRALKEAGRLPEKPNSLTPEIVTEPTEKLENPTE